MNRNIEIIHKGPSDACLPVQTIISIPGLGLEYVPPSDVGEQLSPGTLKVSKEAWVVTASLVTGYSDEWDLALELRHLAFAAAAAQQATNRSGTKIGFFPPCGAYLNQIDLPPGTVNGNKRAGTLKIDSSAPPRKPENFEGKTPEQVVLAEYPPHIQKRIMAVLTYHQEAHWSWLSPEDLKVQRIIWIRTHGPLFADTKPFKIKVEKEPRSAILPKDQWATIS